MNMPFTTTRLARTDWAPPTHSTARPAPAGGALSAPTRQALWARLRRTYPDWVAGIHRGDNGRVDRRNRLRRASQIAELLGGNHDDPVGNWQSHLALSDF